MLNSFGTLLLLVGLLAMPWHDARAQGADDDIADLLLEDFEDGELAETFQIFSIIGVAPGVSGAKYEFDGDEGDSDLEIRSFKIPIKRDWRDGTFCFVASEDERDTGYVLQPSSKVRSDDALCARPYVELNLSYLKADQDVISLEEADLESLGPEALDLDINTLSALAGFGLTFQITERTALRPILLGGYSYVDNDNAFEGELADEFNEILNGSLIDSELNSLMVGGAVELRHERALSNDVELDGNLRYNHLVSSVYEASDEALEGTNDFIVVTGRLEASVPTGLSLFSRDVHALGFGGTNILLEGFEDSINEDDFIHEVGAGLEIRNLLLVRGIRLRGSVLFGEDVSGWRVGLGIKF